MENGSCSFAMIFLPSHCSTIFSFFFFFFFFLFRQIFNYVTESLARLRRVLENVIHLQFVYIHFKKNFKSNNLYLLFTQV